MGKIQVTRRFKNASTALSGKERRDIEHLSYAFFSWLL
jgi:hypothetical protein